MRFLFITKEYPPIPDPSGRIVYNLVQQLCQKGHTVDVIARDSESHIQYKDNETVYWIETSNWEKISKSVKDDSSSLSKRVKYFIASYIRKVLLMFKIGKFPDSEPEVTARVVDCFNKYLQKNKYDCILSFFRPYSCLSAGMKISDKCKDTKLISVYFDLVEKKDCPSFMPAGLYEKLIIKGDEKVFQKSEYVMLPLSAKNNDNVVFNSHKEKIRYYEFPTFVLPDATSESKSECSICSDTIKFVFAGTMNKDFRNPSKMMDILYSLSKNNQVKIQLDIFGGGDCADILNSFKCTENFIFKYHGKVPKETVTKYEQKANFLINIMNNYNSIVPSKIFELFATCKPILNFMTNCDDGSLEYFKQYPVCLTIPCDDYRDIKSDDLAEFILENCNLHVDTEQIKEIYKTSTPEYMTKQILDLC